MIAVLFPMLLGIQANLLPGVKFDPEYVFLINKTTVVHREPVQIITLSSIVICQPFVESQHVQFLRCLLNNITSMTTSKYKDLNFAEVTTKEFEVSQRFQMKFFDSKAYQYMKLLYLQQTLIEGNPNTMIKSLIKHFMYQFDVQLDNQYYDEISYASTFSSEAPNFPIFLTKGSEQSPIGSCATAYAMRAEYKKKHTFINNLYQLRTFMLPHESTLETELHLNFTKRRQSCYYTSEFSEFLAGMQLIKYEHGITVNDDKLELFTIMEVGSTPYEKQKYGSIQFTGDVIFTETVRVKLFNIINVKTISWKKFSSSYAFLNRD